MSTRFIIAGPCVMESYELVVTVAEKLSYIREEFGADIIFKSSFDKANRTESSSFRGPGLGIGLNWLDIVRRKFGLSITTDVHETWQVRPVASVVDIIQIPALLSKQTDLIIAAAKTGKTINIKKGQFMSLDRYFSAIRKAEEYTDKIMLTERGTCFGYDDLIVDFRSLHKMAEVSYSTVFDITHSNNSNPEYSYTFAKAARNMNIDGLFMECHPNPEEALCDSENMLVLDQAEKVIEEFL